MMSGRGGNQLYIALDGYGVYASPPRTGARTLRVVNAADFTNRARRAGLASERAGRPVRAARASGLEYPVLASSETGAQIQVPFEASGPPCRSRSMVKRRCRWAWQCSRCRPPFL